jgi:hypothetical protein
MVQSVRKRRGVSACQLFFLAHFQKFATNLFLPFGDDICMAPFFFVRVC